MKQKFKMYLGIGVDTWNEGRYELMSYNPDDVKIEHRSSVLVREVEVEVDVPEQFDLNSAKVRTLEETLEKERADSQVRQNFLIEQISKLKCISHESAQEEV